MREVRQIVVLGTTAYCVCVNGVNATYPGEDSCRIEFKKKVHGEQQLGRAANRRMVFQPMLGGHDSRCSCGTIER